MTSVRWQLSALLAVVFAGGQPAWGQSTPPARQPTPPAAPTARASAPPRAVTLDAAAAAPTDAPSVTAAKSPSAPSEAAPPASALNPSADEFPRAGGAFGNPELDALMARVTALRTRLAALSAAMFSSKLRVELRSKSEGTRLRALRVSVDGGVVYTAPAQAPFDRPEIVYEHAVAAGPHVVAIEVERQDERAPEFSTWQASRFVVVVPEKRTLWTRLELEDESSLGEDFAEDEAAEYDLGVRLQVEVGD